MRKKVQFILPLILLCCVCGCSNQDKVSSSDEPTQLESQTLVAGGESQTQVEEETQTQLPEESNPTQAVEESQTPSDDGNVAEWSCSEIIADDEDCEFQVSAYDLYMDCGYGWYECKKTGNYQFERTGTLSDVYSEHSDDIDWKVFLLDEPFEDAPRFIAQSAEQELCGDGTVFVEKGRYIVVYCSQNVFGYGTDLDGQVFEGDKEACYRCVYVEE